VLIEGRGRDVRAGVDESNRTVGTLEKEEVSVARGIDESVNVRHASSPVSTS